MSSGPIAAEREAHRSEFRSTPDNARICMRNPDTSRPYCGRKTNKGLVQDWTRAQCTDCAAAARADGRLQ